MIAHGGTCLFDHYSSLLELLQSVYPEYPWVPTKSARMPIGYWEDPANLQKALDKAGEELGIQKVLFNIA